MGAIVKVLPSKLIVSEQSWDYFERYFFVLLFAALTGCSPVASQIQPADGLIVSAGRFPSPSGPAELVIFLETATRVSYAIVKTADQEEVTPGNHFSHLMRWAALWQDDDTLWVHSSDIGLSVWKRDSQDRFSQVWLGPTSQLVTGIPNELWNYLPSSLRRRWESQRDPVLDTIGTSE
jgi:hypothetical protein